MKMTTEEAFVKVLQMHGIEHAFGIIGSAMMPISDCFRRQASPSGTWRTRSNGGMMADGYTRATGKMAMAIAQNGPGVTDFVTRGQDGLLEPYADAAGDAAGGQPDDRPGRLPGGGADGAVPRHGLLPGGGARPSRIAEVLNRVIAKAKRLSAPAQINVPRDYWTQVIDITLPADRAVRAAGRRCQGDRRGGAAAVGSEVPGDPVGRRRRARRRDPGIVWRWLRGSTRRSARTTSTTTAFPGSHPLAVGPLGYNGSKAAMELIAKADVVLALGTRLNPFSTCRAMASTTGRSRRRSSRSTSMPTASG